MVAEIFGHRKQGYVYMIADLRRCYANTIAPAEAKQMWIFESKWVWLSRVIEVLRSRYEVRIFSIFRALKIQKVILLIQSNKLIMTHLWYVYLSARSIASHAFVISLNDSHGSKRCVRILLIKFFSACLKSDGASWIGLAWDCVTGKY